MACSAAIISFPVITVRRACLNEEARAKSAVQARTTNLLHSRDAERLIGERSDAKDQQHMYSEVCIAAPLLSVMQNAETCCM